MDAAESLRSTGEIKARKTGKDSHTFLTTQISEQSAAVRSNQLNLCLILAERWIWFGNCGPAVGPWEWERGPAEQSMHTATAGPQLLLPAHLSPDKYFK